MIGAIQALELFDPSPQSIMLAAWMGRLGQDLFYPPNVGGWNGGRDWLRTGTVIGRMKFAEGLSQGQFSTNRTAPNWNQFVSKHARSEKLDDFVAFLADLLFGGEPESGWIDSTIKDVTATSRLCVRLCCIRLSLWFSLHPKLNSIEGIPPC